MGQQSLLRKPPSSGPLQSPEGDPTWLDQLAHKLGVTVGASEPDNLGEGILQGVGAMVPMLPMGKLLKLMRLGKVASEVDELPRAVNMGDQLLRNHSIETELSPMLKNEFNPKLRSGANDFEGLPIEEVKKGEKLTSAPTFDVWLEKPKQGAQKRKPK
jgi:hypothetical protein